MSSTVLSVDDFEVGSFITILRGKIENKMKNTPEGTVSVLKETYVWDSFKGRVLKIIVIDLPYVVVEYYVQGFDKLEKIHLDTRDLQLKKCSKRYVEIYEPRFEAIKDKPAPDWKFDQEKK